MKFTVLRKPEAARRLTELWTSGADRNAIATAANKIDERLRLNPADQGESRESGRRLLIEPPLGVIFRVSEPERTVSVTTVWQIKVRS